MVVRVKKKKRWLSKSTKVRTEIPGSTYKEGTFKLETENTGRQRMKKVFWGKGTAHVNGERQERAGCCTSVMGRIQHDTLHHSHPHPYLQNLWICSSPRPKGLCRCRSQGCWAGGMKLSWILWVLPNGITWVLFGYGQREISLGTKKKKVRKMKCCWLWRWRKAEGAWWAKECRQPLKAGKARGTDSPLFLQKIIQTCSTLMVAWW